MFSRLLSSNKPLVLGSMILFFVGYLYYQDASTRMEAILAERDAPVLLALANTDTSLKTDLPAVSEPEIATTETQQETASDTGTVDEMVAITPDPATDEVVEDMPPPIALPFSQNHFTLDGPWTIGYGLYSINKDGDFVMGGKTGFTASLAYLQSGESLSNYTFDTVIDWHRGSSLSILARMKDFNNHVSCSFINSGRNVFIVHTQNGERFESKSSPELPTKTFESWKELPYGIRVVDDTVYCLVDDEVVLKQTLPTMPQTGTAGVGIWSAIEGEGLVTIHSVDITEAD